MLGNGWNDVFGIIYCERTKTRQTMPTQQQVILSHLKRYGSITSKKAIDSYGVTRLSAVIHELRKDHKIKAKMVEVSTRYGTVIVAKYCLKRK